MPELYRWVFILPLAESVISTLLGNPKRFQVTPKTISNDQVSDSKIRLIAPLLMILAIQLVSSITLLTNHPLAPSKSGFDGLARILALGWGLLNSLLLATAIRSCWDRYRPDTTPWFSLNLQAVLNGSDLHPGQPVLITAISERGCEFERPISRSLDFTTFNQNPYLLLKAGGLSGSWPVKELRRQHRNGRERIGVSWEAMEDHQNEKLQTFLYRREKLWPVRWAPFDGFAMLALIRRLLQRPIPEDWFSRSQVPVGIPSEAGLFSGDPADR
jgi:hypothetical protein